MSAREVIESVINQAQSDLSTISETIFKNPELNFNERIAHDCLTKYLIGEGFFVEKHYVMDTAFRASFQNFSTADENEKVPNIAVLCEYDALPDIGHACGHNLIAEIGVATALAIKAVLQASATPRGKITVLGCPAEEGGGGKIKLIESGAFKDIDIAMMSHPSVDNMSMPKLPGTTSISVTFSGTPSHACTAPWQGVNALDAAVMAYQGLAVLRQQCKPDWRISAIISKGGSETYIIPEVAELQVCYRAMSKAEQELLGQKVHSCIAAASMASGCKFDVKRDDSSYLTMLHNRSLAELYEQQCASLGLAMCDDPNKTGALVFSTDMGDVSHEVPSIHPVYSIGTPAPNHTTTFGQCAGSDAAQPPTLLQAKALALTAVEVIQNSSLHQEISSEFRMSRQ